MRCSDLSVRLLQIALSEPKQLKHHKWVSPKKNQKKKQRNFLFLTRLKRYNSRKWGQHFNLLVKNLLRLQQISGPAHRFHNCCWLLGLGTVEVKANRLPSQSLKCVRWREAQLQMIKPADRHSVGRARWRTGVRRSTIAAMFHSQTSVKMMVIISFSLPHQSCSLSYQILSAGAFLTQHLDCAMKNCSSVHLIIRYWRVPDELRRDDHLGSGECCGSIKDQYPL